MEREGPKAKKSSFGNLPAVIASSSEDLGAEECIFSIAIGPYLFLGSNAAALEPLLVEMVNPCRE